MASYNKIILIGNLGSDPETRSISADKKVASFSLAISESYTDKNGERQENTQWYRISFWNQKAEVVEKFLKKGNQVYIEGRLSVRTYTDKEGKERFNLEVSGTELTLLGAKTTQNAAGGEGTQKEPALSDSEHKGDDLPF